MAVLKSHGGSCCGAKHLHSFAGDADEATALPALVGQSINGQAQEVILNGGQVAAKPHLLAKMAELGFVLDGHWQNGSHGTADLPPNPTDGQLGSHCYRFTRMDRRKALNDGPIAGRWAGMVMTPGLTGLLTQMRGAAGGPTARAHYMRALPPGWMSVYNAAGGNQAGGVMAAGDTVRVNNTASRRHGREFVIRQLVGDNWYRRAVMHDDQENIDFRLSVGSLTRVRRADAPVPYMPAVGDRLQYTGQTSYSGTYNNGEYCTVTAVAWPNVTVAWDRPTAAACRMHTQYMYHPANPEPRIAPPPAAAAPPPQRHEEAEVLTERPAPIVVREVAPVEVTVLFRTYHNVYRDGRVGAGYDTRDAALDGRRATGRIDRREYLSNGRTRMVENVEE